MRALLSSLSSALLLILSFPPFNIEILAWVALMPLFFAIDGRRPINAFLLSYISGALLFLGTIWWLVHVTLPGMIAVVVYLAFYFGLFGAIASILLKNTENKLQSTERMVLLIGVPAAWVAAEYLRSHLLTGFGWALLGYSQYLNLPVIQIADITGPWGVSFIVVMVNFCIYQFIMSSLRSGKRRDKGRYVPVLMAGLCLFLSLYYGYFRLKNIFVGDAIRVSVIQGNISQDKKWDSSLRSYILDKYVSLTREAASEKPDLIIWPESALPGFFNEKDIYQTVTSLSKETGVPLLVGAARYDDEIGAYYNSAILLSGDGDVAAIYDKVHLVPFGEYVPFKKQLSFVEKFAPIPIGDFSKGKEFTLFKFNITRFSKSDVVIRRLVKKVKFSCLICFEDIFPEIARESVKNGALFLVNMTNDAWFLKTAAPYQHCQASVFRAVEARVNVIRAANTGVSCFIDQKGRITAKVEKAGADTFVEGHKTRDITLSRAMTLYVRYGDAFAYLSIGLILLLLFMSIRAKIKRV